MVVGKDHTVSMVKCRDCRAVGMGCMGEGKDCRMVGMDCMVEGTDCRVMSKMDTFCKDRKDHNKDCTDLCKGYMDRNKGCMGHSRDCSRRLVVGKVVSMEYKGCRDFLV